MRRSAPTQTGTIAMPSRAKSTETVTPRRCTDARGLKYRTWFTPPARPAGFPAAITALTAEGVPATTVCLLQEIYLFVVYVADVALSK